MSKHVDILIAQHNARADWEAEQRHDDDTLRERWDTMMEQFSNAGINVFDVTGQPHQCRTCGHMGYTTAPERPCALCDTIMQGDQDTLGEIGRMMAQHGYEPHQAAEELRQLATNAFARDVHTFTESAKNQDAPTLTTIPGRK